MESECYYLKFCFRLENIFSVIHFYLITEFTIIINQNLFFMKQNQTRVVGPFLLKLPWILSLALFFNLSFIQHTNAQIVINEISGNGTVEIPWFVET